VNGAPRCPLEYIVDEPDDGGFVEFGHLRDDLAATDVAAASAFAERLYADPPKGAGSWLRDDHVDEGVELVCTGLVYLLPTGTTHDGADLVGDDVYDALEGVFGDAGSLEVDTIRWEPCEPDDDGGERWWKIEAKRRNEPSA